MDKSFLKWLSQPAQMAYISSVSGAERERRKAELKQKYEQSKFAAFNSPYIEDSNGIDFLNDEQSIYSADELKEIREQAAFAQLRQIAVQEELKNDGRLTRYIKRRNDETLRSKRIIAQRFTFRPHSYKNDN